MNAGIEILELAAKAAGLTVWMGEWPQDEMLFVAPSKPDASGKVTGIEWNPLTDDGDALRLAVKLQLHVSRTSGVRVSCWAEKAPFDSDESGHDVHREVSECRFGEEERSYAERYGQNWRPDQLSATRLAIVLAAAAIWKAMP